MKKSKFVSAFQNVRSYLAGLLSFFLISAAFGLSESTGPGGSNAQAVHAAGFEGQGITVGLISQSHARVTHEAFFDKDMLGNPIGSSHVHWYDATDANDFEPISHDTSVAGIVCSRGGVEYPLDRGVAPAAELYSYRVTRPLSESNLARVFNSDWLQNALDEALNDNCDIIVTAIQLSSITANGDSLYSLMYDYYAYEYGLFFATASGNNEPEVTIFGDSYNSLTTGGLLIDTDDIYYQVGSQSNPGPTLDGRKKPEVVAPSQGQRAPRNGDELWATATPDGSGQTSWAVPHTAGVAALLLNYANESGISDDEHSEVIKAVIVNSTFPNILDESGNNTIYLSDPNKVWNAYRGYGRLDAFRAYEILSGVRIIPASSTSEIKGWAYATLADDQSHSYMVQGFINERLLATVTWMRRVVWNDSTGSRHNIMELDELDSSIANLDLEVYDPDGMLLSPEHPEYNEKDNLEKWDLLLPKTGTYEIRVVNRPESETSAYGLAFEILEPLAGDVHVDYVVDLLDVGDMASYWLSTNCDDPGQACYGYNLSDNPKIDLSDFAVLAGNWLGFDSRYYPSN